MKRVLIFGLTMLTALLVAGCIDYDEVLEINADGSGTMAMHVVVHKHYFEAIEAMMSSMAPDSSDSSNMFALFTRADIEQRLKEQKSSVKLVDFKETQNDSTATYDLKFSYTDLQEMMRFNQRMGSSDMMGDEPKEPELTFKQVKAGQWQFTRGFQGAEMGDMLDIPTEPNEAEADSTPVEEPDSSAVEDSLSQGLAEMVDSSMAQMGTMMTGMTEMMAKAFGEHKIRMTVKFPGTVTETNATSKSGNSATWEYKFTELNKAPSQLQATIKK